MSRFVIILVLFLSVSCKELYSPYHLGLNRAPSGILLEKRMNKFYFVEIQPNNTYLDVYPLKYKVMLKEYNPSDSTIEGKAFVANLDDYFHDGKFDTIGGEGHEVYYCTFDGEGRSCNVCYLGSTNKNGMLEFFVKKEKGHLGCIVTVDPNRKRNRYKTQKRNLYSGALLYADSSDVRANL